MQGCGREIAGLPCCTVIHGDCDEYLWQLEPGCVDLVVTDPPYGMGFVSGARKEQYAAIVGDDRLPVETIQQLIQIPLLASYFYCRWDNLWDHETLPKPKSVVTWVKPGTGMGDLKHEHGRASEIALFYPGPAHKFKKRPSDILDQRRTGNVVHPTQKPVELIREMLQWYDFQTVLDPYVGSGTTALAALQLDKHFLAFETDPVHFKTASDRINSARSASSTTVVDGGFTFGR
jgi:site-specific DNA-methyltransferase (adenine-specific)